MNDNIREKLSAYLDGALSEMDRKSVEEQLARSEEMRLELEALRAVSSAVKGLPKGKLPAGFLSRLEARRARDSRPEREYFILPPSYRPLAFALSTAVVALVIWDRTHAPTDMIDPKSGWDGDKVAVKIASKAPPSIDVSGRLATLNQKENAPADAASEDSGKLAAPSNFGKHISAPGKPLGFVDEQAPSSPPTEDKSTTFSARNEEERSAINERLYKGLEEEKKRMGIAKIIDKDAEIESSPSGGRDLPSVSAVRGATAKRAASPAVKALTLKSSEALQAAWAAAGLPGEPPPVNFHDQMAVFLAGSTGCGIVDVQNRNKFIVVIYKNSGFDDASARVRAIALSAKPVVVKLAQ